MNSLTDAIKIFVKGVLDEGSKRIAEKFDVSIEEASSLWNDIQLDLPDITQVKKGGTKNTKSTKKKANSDDESDTEESSGCVHKLMRGPRAGESCGEKISGKSQTGNYCTKHITHENKAQSEKKAKKSDKSEKELRIGKNKFGKYSHSATGLVFRSKDEKIVYGRQDEDGKIHKLTDEDIEMCKKYRFQYVKDSPSDEEDSESDEDEETED